MGLLTEVAGIDQKQDALGSAKLEQAVDGGDGSEGFARSGCHVYQGARLAQCQRLLQSCNSADLAVAQVEFGQCGHLFSQAAAQCFRLCQPGRKRFRLEEAEYFSRARYRVSVVGKTDNLTCGLKQKAQRRIVFTPFETGGGVALSLAFGDGEVFASVIFFGFDDTHSNAVHEQHVISRPRIGRTLAHGYANTSGQVESFMYWITQPAFSSLGSIC